MMSNLFIIISFLISTFKNAHQHS